jgi:hypothetical protein
MKEIERTIHNEEAHCFALLLSIQFGHVKVFKYLVQQLHFLWQLEDIK